MAKEFAMKLLVSLLIVAFAFSAHAKRMGPKPVASVLHLGLRYEVPHWSRDARSMKHNGGYVRVVNTRDGLAICTKEIYDVKYDKNLEEDVQDNFITSLKIEGKDLVITSEKLPPIKRPFANFCD